MSSRFVWPVVLGLFLRDFGTGSLRAQAIQLGDGPGSAAQRQYVSVATDAVEVKAGRAGWIELRFRVGPGLHINSHTPHDELLIPTELQVTGGDDVRVVSQQYPAGVPLRVDIGAGALLSTYQGEFAVRLQVVAKADAVLAGVLRYQACDARSCYPARSLPVRVALAAR